MQELFFKYTFGKLSTVEFALIGTQIWIIY